MTGIFNKILRYSFALLILLSACARIGRPTGGDKDTTPPRLLKSIPDTKTTNFNGKEIVLYFDEYVQIKNPTKNLLISPPLQQSPVIVPAGIASKSFKIKFQDSLQPNTTYLINFGNSIVDFNEGNKLPNLQLVFSTGSVIDSLKLKGKIKPVHYNGKADNIIVGLYPLEGFKDSLVFKQKPYYVTTADKNGSFHLKYLRKGKYKIIGIIDQNNDYKYKQGEDAIGFLDKIIEIPGDTLIQINLFQEPPRLNFEKTEQVNKNHLLIEVKGSIDSLQVQTLDSLPQEIRIIDGNQLHIWYDTPKDSIKLALQLGSKTKKYIRKRSKKTDSLQAQIVVGSNPLDTLRITANIPLTAYDKTKIKLTTDSLLVPFDLQLTPRYSYQLNFDKTPGKNYKIEILPGALTDFLGHRLKDTLRANVRIKPEEDFGKLILNFKNHSGEKRFVELLLNNNTYRKTKTFISDSITIPYLLPGKYKVRIVYDTNGNNHWDTGDYLKHRQPEETLEPDKEIEIRPNWDIFQTY